MSRAPNGRSAMIALLGGDGIGPEVVAAGRAVLEAVAERFGHHFVFDVALIGGVAIEETGVPLPRETLAICTRADAVLLGAVGGPRWSSPTAAVRPEQGLLAIRRALGLFANLRPVRCRPAVLGSSPFRPEHLANVDFVVVRELTGGIYFGAKSCEPIDDELVAGERAIDVCSYTTGEIERIVRVAAELARSRAGRLTSVDKANVLETSRLWRRVATRVIAEEYPDVTLEHMLVDTCAMKLVQQPRAFDVVVTENMFGDILTDEAAVLAGSIGLLPSASLGADGEAGTRRGLYEPIHGSAPDIAGMQLANPIGTILSCAMLLRHSLGLEVEARAVEQAVERTIDMGALTPDLAVPGGRVVQTGEVTASVVASLGTAVADSLTEAQARRLAIS
jgi:3-isopropylmalate dehydrogenase